LAAPPLPHLGAKADRLKAGGLNLVMDSQSGARQPLPAIGLKTRAQPIGCNAPTTADWRPNVIHLSAKWYEVPMKKARLRGPLCISAQG
jgi:hypothetical protein